MWRTAFFSAARRMPCTEQIIRATWWETGGHGEWGPPGRHREWGLCCDGLSSSSWPSPCGQEPPHGRQAVVMAGRPSGEGGSVGADYLHKLIPRARHTTHPGEIPHVIFIREDPVHTWGGSPSVSPVCGVASDRSWMSLCPMTAEVRQDLSELYLLSLLGFNRLTLG